MFILRTRSVIPGRIKLQLMAKGYLGMTGNAIIENGLKLALDRFGGIKKARPFLTGTAAPTSSVPMPSSTREMTPD
jgi:hypothetical protein